MSVMYVATLDILTEKGGFNPQAARAIGAQTNKADLVRWVFVVIMGQTAVLLSVLYFFVKYFK